MHTTERIFRRGDSLRLDVMIPRDVKARLIKMAQTEQLALSQLCSRLLASTETPHQVERP